MKALYATLSTLFFVAFATAQTAPFARVHNILQTKCSNSSCHSTNSGANLKFDGTETEVHSALFEVKADNSASNAKFEKRVKAGHPYMSFLLRKVAGAGFDTDLALDANEGSLMVDINGKKLDNPLSNLEIINIYAIRLDRETNKTYINFKSFS